MVTGDEVRQIWGDQVRPVPADLVNPRLSTFTREFLTSVGLPTIQVQEIVPVQDKRLRVSTYHGGREYVIVAENDEPGSRYGIDVATDQVHYLHRLPERNRLLNSDIALFVLFLGIYQRGVLELAVTDQETLENAVSDVWARLRERDPLAAGATDYWRPVLDEVAAEYE